MFEGGVEHLAECAKAGDRRAFTQLMTAHKEDLYRFVRRRVGDADQAYDVVQEAVISAWRAIDRFDPERSFGSWLRTIALNKCRDRARRAAVRRSVWVAEPELASAQAPGKDPSPEEELIARDELAALSRALATLPRHLRDALMLTSVDGLSQSAAGAILGCSAKSIEYRVARARALLIAGDPSYAGSPKF